MKANDLVMNPEACDDLLFDLNHGARSIDPCEFGLPCSDPGAMAQMREMIYQWAINKKLGE